MRCCFFSILCLLFSQHIYAEQVLTSLRSLNTGFRLPEKQKNILARKTP